MEAETKADLICRVCLASARRVYSLQSLSLADAYTALSGTTPGRGEPLPRAACAMCVAQLRAVSRLLHRLRRANQLLMKLIRESKEITPETVKEACEWEPKLDTSVFVREHFASNYCDLHIVKQEEESECEVKSEGDEEFPTDVAEIEKLDGSEDDFYWGESAHDSVVVTTEETQILHKGALPEQESDIAKRNGSTDSIKRSSGTDSPELAIDPTPVPEVKTYQTKEKRVLLLEVLPLTTKANLNQERAKRKRNLKEAKPRAVPAANATGGQIKRKRTEPPKSIETIEVTVGGRIIKKRRTSQGMKSRELAEASDASSDRTSVLKKFFTEQSLSLPEQIFELEKAKLSSNYLQCHYKCDFCYKGFHEEATFARHMKKHDKNNGPHECPVCHIWIKLRRAFLSHVSQHAVLYICKACSFTTKHKETAILHERWHRGIVYSCKHCKESFSRKTSLLSHERIRHPIGSESCPLCGYSYIGKNGVKQHLALRHPGETVPAEGPRCAVCDAMFATEEARDKHHRVSHDRCERNDHPQRYRKDIANRPRPRRRGADEARNIRHRNPPPAGDSPRYYACPDCGEQFATRKEQRQHSRLAHGQPLYRRQRPNLLRVQCEVCGRMFSCVSVLQDHMDVHDAAAAHPCPDCGRTYKTRSRLAIHRKTHTSRYACPLCQKEFNSQNNRDRHYTYVHSTVRNVKCGYCEKVFKDVGTQRLHEKYVHLKTPWPKRVRTRKRAQAES